MNNDSIITGFDLSGYYQNSGGFHPVTEYKKSPESADIHSDGIISHDASTLMSILDAAPVAIQIVGPEGTFIDCNRQTLELFGARSLHDIVGKPPSLLSPPVQKNGEESQKASLTQIQEAFSGKRVTFSWDHRKLSGEIFPARVTLNQIHYEGTPCLMASVIDTSELMAQLDEIASLVKESPYAIFSMDPSLQICDINQAGVTITGYTHAQACSMNFRDLSFLESHGKKIEDAIQTKKPAHGRAILQTPQGIRYLKTSYIPVLSQKEDISKIYAVFADQTSLIEKMNEAEALIQENPAGILTADSEGRILSVNQAFIDICRINQDKLLQMRLGDFLITKKEGAGLKEAIVSKKPEKGRITVDFGSHSRILDSSYIPVLNVNKDIEKLVLMFIDCTEVQQLIEYLDHSVTAISQDITNLASGKTDFESKAIKGNEYTQKAEKNLNTIHESINSTRLALEHIIKDIDRTTDAALSGDLSFRADPSVHQGNFQNIIEKLNNTLDATLTPVAEAMSVSREYARYNFTARFNPGLEVKGDWVAFKDALDQTGNAISHAISLLNQKISELSASIEEANSSVEEITSGSQEIASIMENVSKNSESGDSSIAQIIRAMEDLTRTVSEVSHKADSVAVLSRGATASAKQGMERVRRSEQSMSEIMTAAEHVDAIVKDINAEMNEIGKIVRVISDIANQTNLLSLNAAIEAARAGEAGRGFAVVASEVKSLAQDSRKSAENINEMITTLQQKAKSAEDAMAQSVQVVHDGSSALAETVTSFTDIAQAIGDIHQHITDVAAASEEQAASVEEVTASMQEVAFLTHKTSEEVINTSVAIKQTSAALEQISEVVNTIVVISDGVHQEISRFTVG